MPRPAVTPSSGSGSNVTFSYLFSDPDGFADINVTEMLFSANGAGSNACFLYYERAGNQMWLADDAIANWLGPVPLGANNTLQDSQCVFNAVGSSSSGSGTNLAVSVSLTFKPAFAGTKDNCMNVFDTLWQSPSWQIMGTWTVPGSGCSYSINPSSQSFSSSGGSGSVSVTTGAGCSWSVLNNNPEFITVTAGGNGTGNGTVSYLVAANGGSSQGGNHDHRRPDLHGLAVGFESDHHYDLTVGGRQEGRRPILGR